MSNVSIPRELKNLRACKVCCLIKTLEQFDQEGCDNCEKYLHLKNNREHIFECTSNTFDGMIALMEPKDSWVAKWQRIEQYVPGMYAISVSGDLPLIYVRRMEDKGGEYVVRDCGQKQ